MSKEGGKEGEPEEDKEPGEGFLVRKYKEFGIGGFFSATLSICKFININAIVVKCYIGPIQDSIGPFDYPEFIENVPWVRLRK